MRREPCLFFCRHFIDHGNMALPLERIVLTGFMGSGKSTVGRLLAEHLNWSFLDLDAVIEELAGRTVQEIFAQDGETRFRELEAEALVNVLSAERVVVALGGGAPELLANQQLLMSAPATAVVYLAAPFAILYDRCVQQASPPGSAVRPVLASREHAELRFERRQPIYRAVATHTIESAELTPQQTLWAILNGLGMGRIDK